MANAEDIRPFENAPVQGGMVPTQALTHATHIGESDVPFVGVGDGSSIQLLQVDLSLGLWIVRTKFAPGYAVDTHYHTGQVFAVTLDGSWYYKEYPEYVNRKGSYLFEPAHSVHTLLVPEDDPIGADVWFAIYGANINIDPQGNVTSVVDAQSILAAYRALCEAEGLSHDKVIVNGAP